MFALFVKVVNAAQDSSAVARAISVLPQPGCSDLSMHRQVSLQVWKISGFLNGYMIFFVFAFNDINLVANVVKKWFGAILVRAQG